MNTHPSAPRPNGCLTQAIILLLFLAMFFVASALLPAGEALP